MKLAASGMVLDDEDAFATLAKAAAEKDPSKIAAAKRSDLREIACEYVVL